MDVLKWINDVNDWRRNVHHMWLERKERQQFMDALETMKLEDGAKEEIKAFYSRQCFYDCPTFPYEWACKRNVPKPDVFFDAQQQMYYAVWHGKKLYWKKGVQKNEVQDYVLNLLIEQNENSPHRYELPRDMKNVIIADLGAAEGCFTLDVIERVSHAYLFECDETWAEPLEATFAPWKEKVTIVKKFIGDHGGDSYTTLDEYFADKPLDFVKADIEGAETSMMSSGGETLRHKVRGVNICLYHRPTDEREILALLDAYGYRCKINPGYMLLRNTGDPKTWIRRGVVQARRG